FESRIGLAVLESLAVPAPVVEAVETLWLGHLSLPPATLGDTLLLADQLVTVRSPLDPPQEDDHEAGILALIDFAFNDMCLSDMMKGGLADVESLATILKG